MPIERDSQFQWNTALVVVFSIHFTMIFSENPTRITFKQDWEVFPPLGYKWGALLWRCVCVCGGVLESGAIGEHGVWKCVPATSVEFH